MTRVISTIVGLMLLVTVMLTGRMVFAAVIFLISLIAMYEMFRALDHMQIHSVKVLGYLWCLAIPVIMFSQICGFYIPIGWGFVAVFATVCTLFVYYIIKFDTVSINEIIGTVFAVFYIVLTFLCLGLLRLIDHGQALVWIAFVGAWTTDSFAYLTGMAFGKKKIIPKISPQKTVEGSIGGVLGCMLCMNIFGIIFSRIAVNFGFPPLIFTLLGLLCGIFSQICDWAMSAIKRKAGIKDFGKIMPGHGGVLDRFDSILFISPMILGVLLIS